MGISSANLNPKISDKVAFLVIIIAGAAIAWFTVSVGEKIITNTSKSEVFKVDERLQDEIR